MKRIIFLIINLLIAVGFADAQGVYGTIKYKVTHNWAKKTAAVEYLSQAEKDEMMYVWGNRSEYTEYTKLDFSSKATRYEELRDENAAEYAGYSWRNDEYVIYRNFEENSTYDYMRMLDKLYVVEDSIVFQNWKILNDMREIAGHICMNASWQDTTKMNKIVAWYALDLPISGGPERFGGLPGMILEININNDAMIITAENLTLNQGDTAIAKPTHKRKIKKLTEMDYLGLIINHVQQCKKDEQPYFWGLRY